MQLVSVADSRPGFAAHPIDGCLVQSSDFAGLLDTHCDRVGVAPQHFVMRSDLVCGSTIGPITAARVGHRTVDVGNPMLSMHSCREMAGTADVAPMIAVLTRFYAA